MKIKRIFHDDGSTPTLSFESFFDIADITEIPPEDIIGCLESLEAKKMLFINWEKKEITINSNYHEWVGYDHEAHMQLLERRKAANEWTVIMDE